MRVCSFLLRVSLLSRCELIPQISVCLCEWPCRLKCLVMGLDLFTARFSNVELTSKVQVITARFSNVELSSKVQVMQQTIFENVQSKWFLTWLR